MKKILLSVAFLSATFIGANAQNISFEDSEGFNLGPISGQNNWTLTGTGMLGSNAVVTDETSSEGANSLRINSGNTQSPTLMGVFSSPLSFEETEYNIIQDIYIDDFAATGEGSDVVIDIFEIQGSTYYVTARVVLDATGSVNLVSGMDNNNNLEYENFIIDYEAGWNTLRFHIDTTTQTITYFLNGTQFYSHSMFQGEAAHRLAYRFNDYSTGFNVDNIILDDGALSTSNFETFSVSVYPNPATDLINISNSTEVIDNVTFTDLNGRTVKQVVPGVAEAQINISDLAQGIYILNATSNGKSFTQKIVKQ